MGRPPLVAEAQQHDACLCGCPYPTEAAAFPRSTEATAPKHAPASTCTALVPAPGPAWVSEVALAATEPAAVLVAVALTAQPAATATGAIAAAAAQPEAAASPIEATASPDAAQSTTRQQEPVEPRQLPKQSLVDAVGASGLRL